MIYFNKCADSKLKEITELLDYEKKSDGTLYTSDDALNMTIDEYKGFASRMIRRAPLRNGNLLKYSKVLVQDELVSTLIIPLALALFGNWLSRRVPS